MPRLPRRPSRTTTSTRFQSLEALEDRSLPSGFAAFSVGPAPFPRVAGGFDQWAPASDGRHSDFAVLRAEAAMSPTGPGWGTFAPTSAGSTGSPPTGGLPPQAQGPTVLWVVKLDLPPRDAWQPLADGAGGNPAFEAPGRPLLSLLWNADHRDFGSQSLETDPSRADFPSSPHRTTGCTRTPCCRLFWLHRVIFREVSRSPRHRA